MDACTERFLGSIGSATEFIEVFHTKLKTRGQGKLNRYKMDLTWLAGVLLKQTHKL